MVKPFVRRPFSLDVVSGSAHSSICSLSLWESGVHQQPPHQRPPHQQPNKCSGFRIHYHDTREDG